MNTSMVMYGDNEELVSNETSSWEDADGSVFRTATIKFIRREIELFQTSEEGPTRDSSDLTTQPDTSFKDYFQVIFSSDPVVSTQPDTGSGDYPQGHNKVGRGVRNPLQNYGRAMRAICFASVSLLLQDKGFEGSAARIAELAGMQDMEEGEEPLSLASALCFCDFILEFKGLGKPVLGIFPEGTLSAGWRVADNKHLLLEFLDESNVSFAMIGPDDNASDNKFRLNGRAHRKQVLDILSERGVTQWQS